MRATRFNPRRSALLAGAGIVAAALVAAHGNRADAQYGAPDKTRLSQIEKAELLKTGEALYARHCVGCHGVNGDGRGPAARWLNPKPRDFRDGVFKFRSTPNGALPTNTDLMRTLTAGVIGTSMPAWHLIPDRERFALVEYLKTFAPTIWEDQSYHQAPINLPLPPEGLDSPEQIFAGRQVYEKMACGQCHGETGAGDGPSANQIDDQWGFRVHPANFVKGPLRGGDSPVDIYRTFTTGISGTPMPAYKDDLTEEERWSLVAYILSLRSGGDPHPKNPAPPQDAATTPAP